VYGKESFARYVAEEVEDDEEGVPLFDDEKSGGSGGGGGEGNGGADLADIITPTPTLEHHKPPQTSSHTVGRAGPSSASMAAMAAAAALAERVANTDPNGFATAKQLQQQAEKEAKWFPGKHLKAAASSAASSAAAAMPEHMPRPLLALRKKYVGKRELRQIALTSEVRFCVSFQSFPFFLLPLLLV
jgi:hypothetical protein